MLELFRKALAGDPASLEGLAALITVMSVIPVAIVFSVAQMYRIAELREAKHVSAIELYFDFQALVMQYSHLMLGYNARPLKISEIDEVALMQRDTAFDLLTASFERAFLTYKDNLRSARRRQWIGWDSFIADYIAREDYIEWWWRVIFMEEESLVRNIVAGRRTQYATLTQYDLGFEKYILKKVAPEVARRFLANQASELVQ